MIEGMDWLFGAEYPRVVRKFHPNKWAAGFFWGLYRDRQGSLDVRKDPVRLITSLIKKKCVPVVRVQVLWDDNHSYKASDLNIPAVSQALVKLEALAKVCAQHDTILEVSLFCEHSISPSSMTPILNTVKNLCPGVVVVNSIWRTSVARGFKNEVHGGFDKRAYAGTQINFSLDGVDTFNADYLKFRRVHRGKYVEAFYHWIPQFNRRKLIDDPTLRSARAVRPSPKQIEHLIALAAITPLKDTNRLPAGWVYKPQAEQKSAPVPRGREGKPSMLTPKKIDKLILKNGRRSVAFVDSGRLEDGTHIMRVGKWGVDIAKELRLKPGETADMVADGAVVGKLNPLLRAGRFR